MACVSGSPKRQLNSSTLVPCVGDDEPAVQHAAILDAAAEQGRRAPVERDPRPRPRRRRRRSRARGSSCPCRRCSVPGRRRRCACSPGPGPWAPRGCRRTAPAARLSGPLRNSSISTVPPASPKARSARQSRTAAARLVDVLADDDALAGGQAVGLDDERPGVARVEQLRRAESRSSWRV